MAQKIKILEINNLTPNEYFFFLKLNKKFTAISYSLKKQKTGKLNSDSYIELKKSVLKMFDWHLFLILFT